MAAGWPVRLRDIYEPTRAGTRMSLTDHGILTATRSHA
jgi:hypothetical protein